MGHVVIHREFPAATTAAEIRKFVDEYVASHGDRYGTQDISFKPGLEPFKNRDTAEEWCDRQSGFYAGVAVRFYDFSDCKPSRRMTQLQERLEDNHKRYAEYEAQHSVKMLKAAYVGCSSCGSRLNKEKLRGEKCPLCGTDLRSQSTLDRLKALRSKHLEIMSQLEDERCKDKNKATIKWLVKFEYHE